MSRRSRGRGKQKKQRAVLAREAQGQLVEAVEAMAGEEKKSEVVDYSKTNVLIRHLKKTSSRHRLSLPVDIRRKICKNCA